MDNKQINICFMRFEDRAERITSRQVAETFVSIGPFIELLKSRNNQIMYGRRGTGKTHALRYFQNIRNSEGDLAIYIDGQNIGSNGSIYNDGSLPISERATRLLIDVCSAIHHQLLEIFTDPRADWDFSLASPILDSFISSFMETRIAGTTSKKADVVTEEQSSCESFGDFTLSQTPALRVGNGSKSSDRHELALHHAVSGIEETWIDFNYFSSAIKAIADFIGEKRLWILFDEWTTIPSDIQPYLADMIRRSMFSISNISVKIAAIEHRSNFHIERGDQGYIGFELGADISAAINLDDYLVVDNDENRAKQFFRHFVINHTHAAAEEAGIEINREFDIIGNCFTQENVFAEFVRASEGVPRDAMHILSNAAQRAVDKPISMPALRTAAHSFFLADKYNSIHANPANRSMLEWIRDEVIGIRRTRAFLLPISRGDKIIDSLFDRRALHITNRSRSAAHRPGERFTVYKIDYGLYVDLINTDKFPQGLLFETPDDEEIAFEVPETDARSYRRAVLELDRFYEAHPEFFFSD